MTSREEYEKLYDEMIVPSGRLAAINAIESFAKAHRAEVWQEIDDELTKRACLYVQAWPESKGEALYSENLRNLEWCRARAKEWRE